MLFARLLCRERLSCNHTTRVGNGPYCEEPGLRTDHIRGSARATRWYGHVAGVAVGSRQPLPPNGLRRFWTRGCQSGNCCRCCVRVQVNGKHALSNYRALISVQ
jgi:hypothetical protein